MSQECVTLHATCRQFLFIPDESEGTRLLPVAPHFPHLKTLLHPDVRNVRKRTDEAFALFYSQDTDFRHAGMCHPQDGRFHVWDAQLCGTRDPRT